MTLPPDRFAEPNTADYRAIRRALLILDVFRRIDPKMPLGYAVMLLQVALRPGEGPTEYAKRMGVSQPGASRVLLELADHAREKDHGLGLLDKAQDPVNLRRTRYFLTPLGHRLLDELLALKP